MSLMETESNSELTEQQLMLPPTPGTFQDREDLIKHVRDFGASQGYVVTIKKSRRDRRVILGCDRGGVYRNRRKIEESKRKRKASSRLINCPFEAIGKREDDTWVLTIKNGEHNHEALRDMSEHPYSRRFTEEEVRQIKLMTEAGVKPRQVLKALKKSNPELQSTPRHLYNLKAKIRQGNFTDKSSKAWRPNISSPVTSSEASTKHNCPVKVPNLIGGKFVESQACAIIDVVNPATQKVVSQVPLTSSEEFKAAVSAANQAFPSWKNTPVTTRQRIMFKLQELIRRDIDKLAMNIAIEQGKTLSGARGDVLRGLEVVEHACGMATLQMGQFVPNASNGIDTYCIREPLGVCAGICPLNFPAMISLWMFPIAVTCGNTFILKPSEKNPGASMILAELAIEAGLPAGVLNIVHGTHDIVNHICDDDDIKAISLIGSNTAGMHIYARAAARGKRVQSNMGAKNHAIIMPDASVDTTLNSLVAAGFGAAGQRCMTLSTAVFVGGSRPWEEELVERAKALKVNSGTEPGADLGPVISKEAKDQICRLVQNAVESGARLVLDGRNIVVPRYEHGNFVGPTILCDVTTGMECYKEEMFGPVLLCIKVDSLDEAIAIVNRHKYGNGATIFTTSGVAARKFQNDVEAGLVGINVPVPIPLPFSSFNGSKSSFAGDLNFCAKAGVQFYTQIKTVAQQWEDLPIRLSSPLPLPPTSEMETSQGVSLSRPLTSESDLPSREVSPAMPCTSETDLQNPKVLQSIEIDEERDSMSESDRNSERMYIPQASKWDETRFSFSEKTCMPPTSHRIENTTPTPQMMDITMGPTPERLSAPTSQDSVCHVGPTPERLLVPPSLQNDNAGPAFGRLSVPPSHRNDSVGPTPDRLSVPPINRNDSVGPTPKKLSVHRNENVGIVSLMNENMGATSRRADINLRPSSERVYMPTVSNQTKDSAGPPQMQDPSMHSNPETLYILASQRSDSIGLMPLRMESSSTMGGPGPERMYMTPLSYRSEVGRSATIEMYMSSSSSSANFERNKGVVLTPERLCMPANPQRMYAQTPIISMGEYSGQGVMPNLPTSQSL
ncbi:hypothetical protein LguiB_032790 [Lonicera macranthoides]